MEKSKKHHHKQHPHHKGGGMAEFEHEHWQKPIADVMLADGKYGSEMGQAAEYKESVDKLAAYAKKHKMKY